MQSWVSECVGVGGPSVVILPLVSTFNGAIISVPLLFRSPLTDCYDKKDGQSYKILFACITYWNKKKFLIEKWDLGEWYLFESEL